MERLCRMLTQCQPYNRTDPTKNDRVQVSYFVYLQHINGLPPLISDQTRTKVRMQTMNTTLTSLQAGVFVTKVGDSFVSRWRYSSRSKSNKKRPSSAVRIPKASLYQMAVIHLLNPTQDAKHLQEDAIRLAFWMNTK